MEMQDIILSKMGESITSATILSWAKQVGDSINQDEMLCEVATDKVDTEIPSPYTGVVTEILFKEGDEVEVGKVIARVNLSQSSSVNENQSKQVQSSIEDLPSPPAKGENVSQGLTKGGSVGMSAGQEGSTSNISPLVRALCIEEGITENELKSIKGSGEHSRVTKNDILAYIKENSSNEGQPSPLIKGGNVSQGLTKGGLGGMSVGHGGSGHNHGTNVEVKEMSRMGKLIADHMVHSKQTSPHVTAYVEVDMTDLVTWRNKVKLAFQEKYGERLTFTPLFVEAVCKAIVEFPDINASLDGDKILLKKDVNIGVATALPDGNLIVPVIPDADKKNLLGLARNTNSLVQKARTNSLLPEDIQGGTFTISNVGTFRNVMGTPIINQPQAAILATGMIRKKPAVIETPEGDVLGVRQMMYLSLSFDHRFVNGHLGGSFLARIGDHLQEWDLNREI